MIIYNFAASVHAITKQRGCPNVQGTWEILANNKYPVDRILQFTKPRFRVFKLIRV